MKGFENGGGGGIKPEFVPGLPKVVGPQFGNDPGLGAKQVIPRVYALKAILWVAV